MSQPAFPRSPDRRGIGCARCPKCRPGRLSEEASPFRLLGAIPGQGIDARLAAAVAGATADDIDPLTGRLADAHLIEAGGPGRHAIGGRCLLLLATALVAQGNRAAAIPRYERAHRLLLPVKPDMAALAKELADEVRLVHRKRPR